MQTAKQLYERHLLCLPMALCVYVLQCRIDLMYPYWTKIWILFSQTSNRCLFCPCWII